MARVSRAPFSRRRRLCEPARRTSATPRHSPPFPANANCRTPYNTLQGDDVLFCLIENFRHIVPYCLVNKCPRNVIMLVILAAVIVDHYCSVPHPTRRLLHKLYFNYLCDFWHLLLSITLNNLRCYNFIMNEVMLIIFLRAKGLGFRLKCYCCWY